MKTAAITVNSLDIFYRQSGSSGFPVVFVHGNSMSSRTFEKQMESDLADLYRLFALDLPGQGKSSRSDHPDADYSLRGYAETLAEFVKKLDLEDALFVGWSLGGYILLEASDLLSHAAGYLIFGTSPVSTEGAAQIDISANPAISTAFKGDVTEDERELFLKAFFHPDYGIIPQLFREDFIHADKRIREVLAKVVESGAGRDEVEIVKNLDIPLAIIHGEADEITDLSYLSSLQYANLYKNEIIMIPDSGHAPHWEVPETFNAILRNFIQDCHRH